MHHYIYQVSLEPIPPSCFLTAYFFEGRPDLLPIANTISDIADCRQAKSSLGEWLTENRLGTLSQEQFTLTEDAKKRYFSGRYRFFRQAAKQLAEITEEQFLQAGEAENLLCDVNRRFNERYDVYFLGDDWLPISADTFFRSALSATPYYIGGVLDYQY
ncbi:hypothetical protein [Hungatella hathewayi]|uniref:hypothetical protein n=1 Tax=Hungatella hathewayi TaxID=154046 RepID=UPI0011DD78BE|nr:hypothetical protein [Hungatella hathewayi]